jgi:hypothetical protein
MTITLAIKMLVGLTGMLALVFVEAEPTTNQVNR